MRISLITSVPLVPPWDQADKNLAYALTAALPDHHFQVLTARGQPVPPGDNLQRLPLFSSRDPSLLEKLRIYSWFLSRPLARTVGSDPGSSPDLYHFVYQPYPLSSWLSRRMPDFRHRPSVHTVPATASRWTANPGLFFADRLVAISRYGRRKLEELGLCNVTYIPPGIDPSPWQSLVGQTARFKAELGLAGHPVALFPGHYGPGQGSEVMLRALPLLAVDCPGLRVLFACRIRSKAERTREIEVQRSLDALGLSDMVRLHNTVRDMRPLVGASDVVILPLETMRDKVDIPNILLEFLAAGKPIAISDLSPMSELIEDADAPPSAEPGIGLLFPPGDAEGLAQAVVKLLVDPALRERMGWRGQARVREQFAIRRVARQYDVLYHEMTG